LENSKQLSRFSCKRDDGVFGKLKRNVTGLLIFEIDFEKEYMDLSSNLRDKVSWMKLY